MGKITGLRLDADRVHRAYVRRFTGLQAGEVYVSPAPVAGLTFAPRAGGAGDASSRERFDPRTARARWGGELQDQKLAVLEKLL